MSVAFPFRRPGSGAPRRRGAADGDVRVRVSAPAGSPPAPAICRALLSLLPRAAGVGVRTRPPAAGVERAGCCAPIAAGHFRVMRSRI